MRQYGGNSILDPPLRPDIGRPNLHWCTWQSRYQTFVVLQSKLNKYYKGNTVRPANKGNRKRWPLKAGGLWLKHQGIFS